MSASPEPSDALGKRKRDDESDDEEPRSSLFIPKEDDIVPEGSNMLDGDSDIENIEYAMSDDQSDGGIEEVAAPQQNHDEDAESFPKCVIYDKDIPAIINNLTNIPKRIESILNRYDCDSRHVKVQLKSAAELSTIPPTRKLRIASLGGAGAGRLSIITYGLCLADCV